jgi:elongation factor P hydroxylase
VNHTEIAACFNAAFYHAHTTQMRGGASEPLYLPAADGEPARLCYREDYAASALHEAAHWCIAGKRRRALVDFGYDYAPPPRSEAAQRHFFAQELRTQALESLFAKAAGVEFQPSADNLQADLSTFVEQLRAALPDASRWVCESSDPRARQFIDALEGWRGTR